MRVECVQIHVALNGLSIQVLFVANDGIQSAHIHYGQSIHEDGTAMIFIIHSTFTQSRLVIRIGVPNIGICFVVASLQDGAVIHAEYRIGTSDDQRHIDIGSIETLRNLHVRAIEAVIPV